MYKLSANSNLIYETKNCQSCTRSQNYDEAINFYTQKLHFDLIEDTKLSEEKRWVIVRPKGSTETGILLAKAANEDQAKAIGNQSGGRLRWD